MWWYLGEHTEDQDLENPFTVLFGEAPTLQNFRGMRRVQAGFQRYGAALLGVLARIQGRNVPENLPV
jgi:hypothetical protein